MALQIGYDVTLAETPDSACCCMFVCLLMIQTRHNQIIIMLLAPALLYPRPKRMRKRKGLTILLYFLCLRYVKIIKGDLIRIIFAGIRYAEFDESNTILTSVLK